MSMSHAKTCRTCDGPKATAAAGDKDSMDAVKCMNGKNTQVVAEQ